MRQIPPALQAKLDDGATTICRCWRLDRADGAVLGFTDHDQSVMFDGVTFEPGAAVSASALDASAALGVDTIEIVGALSSDALSDMDIARGLYDAASLRWWLVDWSSPELRVLMFRGRLGEVRRRGARYEAELRGLTDRLTTVQGRTLTRTCDAVLGDARCGVSLDTADYRRAGAIADPGDGRRLRVSGLSDVMDGWFSRGRLQTTTTDGVALDLRVASHRRDSASSSTGDIVELEETPIDVLALGQAVVLVAGCDKRLETCRAKFDNLLNFRGFPHAPGDSWALSYPRSGQGHDGGSRFSSG